MFKVTVDGMGCLEAVSSPKPPIPQHSGLAIDLPLVEGGALLKVTRRSPRSVRRPRIFIKKDWKQLSPLAFYAF